MFYPLIYFSTSIIILISIFCYSISTPNLELAVKNTNSIDVIVEQIPDLFEEIQSIHSHLYIISICCIVMFIILASLVKRSIKSLDLKLDVINKRLLEQKSNDDEMIKTLEATLNTSNRVIEFLH